MNNPLRRIRRGGALLAFVSIASVVGYRYVSGYSWLDSLYWYVITVSSLGYTEKSTATAGVQTFTILVVLIGMTVAFYTVGGFVQLMTEGEVERMLGIRRLTREIKKLEGHIIVCGYGRIGQMLVQELSALKRTVLVIEQHLDRAASAREQNFLALSGDATQEETLLAAGVERAETLVCALPSDADNVFITLTCRNLNPTMQIIARAEYVSSEKKLLQAGASRVVLPLVAGAQRIARLIVRPRAAEVIDHVVNRDLPDVDLDELLIPATSSLIGLPLRDSTANQLHRLLIIAVSRASGEKVFNPRGDFAFQADDTLIVMGHTADIDKFRETYGC